MEASQRTNEVLVVASTPPPFHGSTVMAERFLEALSARGFRSILIRKELSKTIDDIGRLGLGKILRALSLWLRTFWTCLRHPRVKVAVVFITCSPASFLVDFGVAFVLALFRVRSILYTHGIGFRVLAGRGRLWQMLVAFVLKRSACTVVLGELGKSDLRPWVAEERLVAIPNTISEPNSQAERSDDPAAPIRVLYLSTLDPEKGAGVFVEMAAIVHKENSGVEFLLAGQSSSREFDEEIEGRIQTLGLAGIVKKLGPVYGAEKDAVLASADIFVFPTRYRHENFPLVNLEAMAHRLPVVTSDQGCISEQIVDGQTGYIVAPEDLQGLAKRVLELCRNETLRRDMGREGRERFEREYSQAAFADRWEVVLSEVLLSRRGAE